MKLNSILIVRSHLEESGARILYTGILAGAWGKPHVYCDHEEKDRRC